MGSFLQARAAAQQRALDSIKQRTARQVGQPQQSLREQRATAAATHAAGQRRAAQEATQRPAQRTAQRTAQRPAAQLSTWTTTPRNMTPHERWKYDTVIRGGDTRQAAADMIARARAEAGQTAPPAPVVAPPAPVVAQPIWPVSDKITGQQPVSWGDIPVEDMGGEAIWGHLPVFMQQHGLTGDWLSPFQRQQARYANPLHHVFQLQQQMGLAGGAPIAVWEDYLQPFGAGGAVPAYGQAGGVLAGLMDMGQEARGQAGIDFGQGNLGQLSSLLQLALRPSLGIHGARAVAGRLGQEQMQMQAAEAGGAAPTSFLDHLRQRFGLQRFGF